MIGYFKWLLGLFCDGLSPILKGNSDCIHIDNKDAEHETSDIVAPSYGSGIGGGTRAGLFRTPISGGVQSATSAHGLPRPALAVRNLMEQVRLVTQLSI